MLSEDKILSCLRFFACESALKNELKLFFSSWMTYTIDILTYKRMEDNKIQE